MIWMRWMLIAFVSALALGGCEVIVGPSIDASNADAAGDGASMTTDGADVPQSMDAGAG
jgi:hypothetical protein